LAQKQDSIPVRSLVERGAQGDVLLGKETRKAQLTSTPRGLQIPGSACEKKIYAKKKKAKPKKTTK